MKSTLNIILLTLIVISCLAQTYTVETVPNTKLINNSYVSNPDNILSPATVDEIDRKLGNLEKQTTAQVAVVAIQSIGEEDIFTFAQALYERWGIGGTAKSNGLLILLVLDQRTVRFHTGYGMEGVLPDAICKRIQMTDMVPMFKVEDYNRGVINGVDEVIYILTMPQYAEDLYDQVRRESSGWNTFFIAACVVGGLTLLIWFISLSVSNFFPKNLKYKPGTKWTPRKDERPYPEMSMSRMEWLLLFAVIPTGLLFFFDRANIDTDNHILFFLGTLYSYLVLTLIYKQVRMKRVTDRLLKKQDYFGAATFFKKYQGFWATMAFFFPMPYLPAYFFYVRRQKSFRDHPRDCKACGIPLKKLDEKTDDQYLKASQVFEEKIKSVDYDVWLCSGCGKTEILNFDNSGSRYRACPKCRTKAFNTESTRTLTAATYTSEGTGQSTERCKFCNHTVVSTYSIAKLTPPSEERESSSSSSSSDSSDSGGSWGGGSSGGGGASSSW